MAELTLKFVNDVNDHDYEVIEFHGDLDQSTLADAEVQITEAQKKFTGMHLIFDLSNLGFINSEGIGFCIMTHKELSKQGKELILCALKPNVAEVMKVMGLEQLVKIFNSISEAINYIKKTK